MVLRKVTPGFQAVWMPLASSRRCFPETGGDGGTAWGRPVTPPQNLLLLSCPHTKGVGQVALCDLLRGICSTQTGLSPCRPPARKPTVGGLQAQASPKRVKGAHAGSGSSAPGFGVLTLCL